MRFRRGVALEEIAFALFREIPTYLYWVWMVISVTGQVR
jgi:hypothetical protein